MIKPILKGKVFAVNSELSTFKNRTTQVEESYMKHSVDMICTEPQKGVATIKVYSNNQALAIKEGADYVVELSRFEVEKGAASYQADEKNFKPVKG
jgi:hypothetical protein